MWFLVPGPLEASSKLHPRHWATEDLRLSYADGHLQINQSYLRVYTQAQMNENGEALEPRRPLAKVSGLVMQIQTMKSSVQHHRPRTDNSALIGRGKETS
jgi:hypothetical protein